MWRLLVLGLVLFAASPARAEPGAARRTEPRAQEEGLDYRWSLVLSDAVALTTISAGALLDNEGTLPLVVTGIGVYALVPAVVHGAHGQTERAAISAGMRIGFPAVGVGIGALLIAQCDTSHGADDENSVGDFCPLGGVLIGGLFVIAGAVTAAVIDDAALGKVPPKVKNDAPRQATWSVTPLVSPRRSAVGVSVVGAF